MPSLCATIDSMHKHQGEATQGQFSATHNRSRLLRRLRTLRSLEWFNIPFLILVLYLASFPLAMRSYLWHKRRTPTEPQEPAA